MIVRLFLACTLLSLALTTHAGVIGVYDFSSSLPSGEGSVIAAVPEANSQVLLAGAIAFLGLGVGRNPSGIRWRNALRAPASMATLLSLTNLGCGDSTGPGEKSSTPPSEQSAENKVEWHYKMGTERVDGIP